MLGKPLLKPALRHAQLAGSFFEGKGLCHPVNLRLGYAMPIEGLGSADKISTASRSVWLFGNGCEQDAQLLAPSSTQRFDSAFAHSKQRRSLRG